MELWLWCMSCNYASPINLPDKLTEGKKMEEITLPYLSSEAIRKELIPFDNDRFVKIKTTSNIYAEMQYDQYLELMKNTQKRLCCLYCGASFQSLESWHYIRSINEPSSMHVLPEIGVKYDLWDLNPFGGDADAGNFE